jgi:hypothetical protein
VDDASLHFTGSVFFVVLGCFRAGIFARCGASLLSVLGAFGRVPTAPPRGVEVLDHILNKQLCVIFKRQVF